MLFWLLIQHSYIGRSCRVLQGSQMRVQKGIGPQPKRSCLLHEAAIVFVLILYIVEPSACTECTTSAQAAVAVAAASTKCTAIVAQWMAG